MSTDNNHPDNHLAFSSRCLPGSEAERKERERLEAFRRQKAEQEGIKRASAAQRHQDYEVYYEANRERIQAEEAAKLVRAMKKEAVRKQSP